MLGEETFDDRGVVHNLGSNVSRSLFIAGGQSKAELVDPPGAIEDLPTPSLKPGVGYMGELVLLEICNRGKSSSSEVGESFDDPVPELLLDRPTRDDALACRGS